MGNHRPGTPLAFVTLILGVIGCAGNLPKAPAPMAGPAVGEIGFRTPPEQQPVPSVDEAEAVRRLPPPPVDSQPISGPPQVVQISGTLPERGLRQPGIASRIGDRVPASGDAAPATGDTAAGVAVVQSDASGEGPDEGPGTGTVPLEPGSKGQTLLAAAAESVAAPTPLTLPDARGAAKDNPFRAEAAGPVTLHVDKLDVRKVLEMLSRQTRINILVSDKVSGPVTLNLQEVSVNEALAVILKSADLRMKQERDYIFILTPDEEKKAEEMRLPIRVYHLGYVRATDMQKMVQPMLTRGVGKISATPASVVGIKADADNAGGDSMAGGEILVVQDYQRVLQQIDQLVAQIDVQPIQIQIQAVILDVKHHHTDDLAVNFGILDRAFEQVLGLSGSGAALNAMGGAFTPGQMVSDATGKLAGTILSGLAKDSYGLKVGYVGKHATALVTALETMADVKVLACPRINVLNRQRADLQLGDKLGYKTITQTQTSTVEKVEFLQLGTQLRVRPFVQKDGRVRMEIHPERASGFIDKNQVPQSSIAQVTTNVIVPDGETYVIGGLMQTETEEQREGIPGLMNLPWVGWAFRHTYKAQVQKELVVLLTPTIWRPAASGRPVGSNPPPDTIPPPGMTGACGPAPCADPAL